MYCPKCGQSQVSADVRFCSRCGFPLVAVGDLLITGGIYPAHLAGGEGLISPQQPPQVSPRRRGVKHGVALLLVAIFLLPFFGILHEVIGLPQEFMALSTVVAMLAILRLIYAGFFEEGAPRLPRFAAPQSLYAPPQTISPRMNQTAQEMLLPAQGTPIGNYRQPHVDTSEIMHPPSVTDQTTRLLDKQSGPSER